MAVGDEVLADVRRRARVAAVGGYQRAADVEAELIELIQYDPATRADFDADAVENVRRVVEEEFGAARDAERDFPPTTDCDRLELAFSELEAAGILAGQNVGFDMGDVRDEMWARVDAAGSQPRGWVAFHGQDVERVVTAGDLYLAFSSVSQDRAGDVAIGDEIVASLAAAGLSASWSRDPGQRIQLVGLRWQRRRRARRAS